MSDVPDGVIPYVEYHDGPRRVLTVDLTGRNPLLREGRVPPIVSIDGRQYIVAWEAAAFQIPADRPCHISVHVEGNVVTQAASTLVPPGEDVHLTYRTRLTDGVAHLE